MNYSLIKELAYEQKISIRKLCKKIGMSEQGFSAAIKNNTLKIRDLEKIAAILEYPVSGFFDKTDNKEVVNLYKRLDKSEMDSSNHYTAYATCKVFFFSIIDIIHRSEDESLKKEVDTIVKAFKLIDSFDKKMKDEISSQPL